MRLYHGSNVLGLDVLEPRIADHMREKNMLEMPEGTPEYIVKMER